MDVLLVINLHGKLRDSGAQHQAPEKNKVDAIYSMCFYMLFLFFWNHLTLWWFTPYLGHFASIKFYWVHRIFQSNIQPVFYIITLSVLCLFSLFHFTGATQAKWPHMEPSALQSVPNWQTCKRKEQDTLQETLILFCNWRSSPSAKLVSVIIVY